MTAPANAATMKVYLYDYLASGWVAFDDVSVIKVGTSTNLVADPGFESGTNWTAYQETGSHPATSFWRSTWGTATPHSGTYAYTISNHAYGIFYSAPIPVTPGEQYNLSTWIRGRLDPDITSGGWILRARYYDVNNQLMSVTSDAALGGSATLTATWAQKSGQITVPTGAAKMRIDLYDYLSGGWVTYDDVSVVKVGGSGANLVPNPDFLALTYNQKLSSSIPVTMNNTYSLSALVKGNGGNATGTWAARVHYYNSTGTLLTAYTDIGSASGTTTTTGQTVGGTFTVPSNATSVKISLSSALTAGALTINNVTLSQSATVTKYYFAGTQRVAMRQGSTLNYLLSDHLGSTSITTNASGALVSELRYKPWGEVRYPVNGQNPGPSNYTFTGQYSNIGDFGLMFYNARWYDPALGRFAQADTIVPGGVQGLDRYAYVNNSPLNYTDPSGHESVCGSSNSDPECNDNWLPTYPNFIVSPVSEEDLQWIQWFGPTEFAYQGGSNWGYDYYCQGYHCGVDFGGNWGDPVFAGVYGEVIDFGEGAKGYGYYMVIQVGDYYVLYQALDGNFMVEAGDVVTPETIIAGVGNHDADPNAGNDHLHLEVMHYSLFAVIHNSYWGWRGDLIENPLLYMDQSISALLSSMVPASPSNNVTFHTVEQNPLLQPSPMHRGGTPLW